LLDVFRAVTETGSATNAAELVGMSQPAVTKSIAELERFCGMMLFERDRYGMRFTANGQLLYGEVLHNLAGLDRIRRSIRGDSQRQAWRCSDSGVAGKPPLS